VKRAQREQAFESAGNLQQQRIQGLQERELTTEPANIASELNPVFGTCGAAVPHRHMMLPYQ
jgi:hypothetical protein